MGNACDPRKRGATLAACGVLVLYVVLAVDFLCEYGSTDTGVELLSMSDPVKITAVTLFLSKLQSLGNVSLTLLGVLWAFLIYKESQVRVLRFPNNLLFVVTNVFFLSSFALYFYGYDLLVSHLFFDAALDLEAPILKLWASAQVRFFAAGVVSFVLTVLMGRTEQ